jgi:CarD family transcriptional regulator
MICFNMLKSLHEPPDSEAGIPAAYRRGTPFSVQWPESARLISRLQTAPRVERPEIIQPEVSTVVEFTIGDKAVYPAQGVAEVVGIENKEINGTLCSFYVLRVLDSEMQILVPKEKADQVGLRPLATNDEIEEVFDILREQDIHIDKQTWNRRYRGFMEKIKTGSLFEVAEVFRDLYRLKSSKALSFGERRMLDTAKGLIVKELSVARNWDEQRVEKELEKAFAA